MKYDFLLGKSDSFWTDKREIPQLKEALINYHKKVTHKNPWVLQWVLTPNAKYIAKHPFGSVEKLSKSTHKELVPFLKDIKNQFPLNIIMVDFINKEVCQDIINLNFN